MTKYLRSLRRLALLLSMKGFSRGPHITRYAMYNRLSDLGKQLPRREGRVLAVSHSSKLCNVLELKVTELVEANYPDYDLLNLPFDEGSFDFVLTDQVLEHVAGNPQLAINESWRVLRPGGIAVHTTCFINPIHDAPHDYWRFTPAALKLLLENARFSNIIECDGWGNYDAWDYMRIGLRFEGIPHAKWHPIHKLATKNEPDWPIVTWGVAVK
jgi:SAM-dependent methyltransferase